MERRTQIILQRFTDNPRIPQSNLASELRLSKNAVSHRIQVLKDEKVILGSTCIVNYFALGFRQYILYLKSSVLFSDSKVLSRIPKDSVLEILSLYGKYNCYVKFICKDEPYAFVQSILDSIVVEDYELIELEQYDLKPAKKYFLEPKRLLKSYTPFKKGDFFSFDVLDLSILRALVKNSEQSLALIAYSLGKSPQVIAYRFNKLQSIIRLYGYTDIFSQDLQLYFLRFEYSQFNNMQKLFRFLISNAYIQDVSFLSHKQNVFCVLESKTRGEVLVFIRELLIAYPECKSVELDIFADQLYYNFFPKVLDSDINRLGIR